MLLSNENTFIIKFKLLGNILYRMLNTFTFNVHLNNTMVQTNRSSLSVWVGPAGSHGADDGSARVHVNVPPGYDHLRPPAGLSQERGRVRLRGAAHWLTEVHTGKNSVTKDWGRLHN